MNGRLMGHLSMSFCSLLAIKDMIMLFYNLILVHMSYIYIIHTFELQYNYAQSYLRQDIYDLKKN